MFIRVKGAADPSPTLHHPSPWLFLGCEIISEPMFSHLLWSAPAIYYGQLLSSMMAGLLDKVKGRWRVGEGLHQPFTSHNPSVYRGFRRKGEGWRVKLRVRFFTSKTTLPVAGKHIPNGDGRPTDFFLPTHHFVPGNGKKLPQLRAILCHS